MTINMKNIVRRGMAVAVIAIVGISFFGNALAQTPACPKDTICTKLIVPIPGTPGVIVNPADYIVNFYQFSIGFAGLFAMLIIVYAGIKWTASAGNQSAISEAKDMVTNAVWGLALLLGAFLILNTIDPKLTSVRLPELGKAKVAAGVLMDLTKYHEVVAAAHVAGSAEIEEQRVLRDPKSTPLQRAQATYNADVKESEYYSKLVDQEKQRVDILTAEVNKFKRSDELKEKLKQAQSQLDSFKATQSTTKIRVEKSRQELLKLEESRVTP